MAHTRQPTRGGHGPSANAYTIETWVLPMVIVSLDAFNRPVRQVRTVSNHLRANLDGRGWANRAMSVSSKLNQVAGQLEHLDGDIRDLINQVRDRVAHVNKLAEPFSVTGDILDTGITTQRNGRMPWDTPTPGTALSQRNPVGDESILNLKRLENANGSWSTGEAGIDTVREHIQAYGCLMTAFTMLLQGKGVNIQVTDLYKANYELRTGRKFDEDARDGTIVVSDLYADANMVSRAASGYGVRGDTLVVNTDAEANRSLQSMLSNHGSVAIHMSGATNDGHWVVIDGYNADGTYKVRDPLTGVSSTATIGVSSGQYRINTDGGVRYVDRQP